MLIKTFLTPLNYLLLIWVILNLQWLATTDTSHLSVETTFVGSTPCSKNIKPIRSMDTSDCEFAKWTIVISDVETGKGHFTLHCVYGMTLPGTTQVRNGGAVVDLKGTWITEKGMAGFPNAQVIRLDPDGGTDPIRLVKLNERLLHMLDEEKKLMIGNPAWSYTFSMTK